MPMHYFDSPKKSTYIIYFTGYHFKKTMSDGKAVAPASCNDSCYLELCTFVSTRRIQKGKRMCAVSDSEIGVGDINNVILCV